MQNVFSTSLKQLVFLFLIGLFFSPLFTLAQQKTRKLKFSGSLGVTEDHFWFSSNDTLYRPYRPNSITRFSGNAMLNYGKFSMPFSISYTLQASNLDYKTPVPPKFNLNDLLNNYNQLSFSPTFGSMQLFLGTQVPKYSELTSGDLPLFGGGFEWKPKKFRLAAFYGMAQRGIDTDSILKNPGSYRRMSMGAKIGVGHEDSSHIYLVALKHIDDKNSAKITTEGIRPQENLVISLDQKLRFFKKFYIQAELALSAFSQDLNDATLESDSFHINAPPYILNLFSPRYTSSFGGAGTSSMGYDGKVFSFRAVTRAYSSDYKSLNYPFLQSDRLEWLIEPRFKLFKNKLLIGGSVGKRSDNLFANKRATAYQTLSSVNISIQVTKSWNLSSNYSNFGIRNTMTNDTFRLQNVSQNFGVSSTYTIPREKITHAFIASYSRDNYEDFNIVSSSFSNNQTQVYVISYNMMFTGFPLVLSTTGTHFENVIYLGKLNMNMASVMASYPFGKNKNLNTSLQANYMHTSLYEYSPDENINTSLSITYTILKRLNLGTNASINLYKYGTAKPGVQNKETSLRMLVNYTF